MTGGRKAQAVLEMIPVLPDVVVLDSARTFLSQRAGERTGFFHSSGEWNFLIKYDKRMYRVPESNMELRALAEKRGAEAMKGGKYGV